MKANPGRYVKAGFGPLLVLAVMGALVGQTATHGERTAGHVLRRAAFGPTPADLAVLAANPVVQVPRWLEKQLDDAVDVDQEAFSPTLAALVLDIEPGAGNEWTLESLQRYQVALAIYSEWQLRERMVEFWESHFNTSYDALSKYYYVNYYLCFFLEQLFGANGDPATADYTGFDLTDPLPVNEHVGRILADENSAFRTHALGSFRDLLYASAKSPPMVLYLNSFNNIVLTFEQPNENYAREMMELHTLGKDEDGNPNGYTESDVVAVARCFSGWSVRQSLPEKLVFHYRDYFHDTNDKGTFLTGLGNGTGLTLGAGGDLSDGEAVLDFLIQADETKDFMCRKLIKFFITEDEITPTSGSLWTLLQNAKAAWGPDGDIREVLRVILVSLDFVGATHRWNKIGRPWDSMLGTVRILEGEATQGSDLDGIISSLNAADQKLFRWGAPDGLPMVESEKWATTLQVLERANANQVLHTGYVGWQDPNNWLGGFTYDLPGYFASQGIPLDDETLIVDHFLRLRYQDGVGSEDRAKALAFISTDTEGNAARTFAWLIAHGMFDELGERITHFLAYVNSLPASVQK